MRGVDKRLILVTVVVAVTLLQAGLAGAARYLRGDAEGHRAEARDRRENAAIAVELAEAEPPRAVGRTGTPWRLAGEPDVSRTMQFVQAAGDTAGVALSALEVVRSADRGKQVVRVAGKAAPERLCALLAAIEAREELLVVEAGQVQPGTATEVAFELTLASHHVEPEGGR